MAKEWAKPFYDSETWREVSRLYRRSVGGLCERCYERGIVRAASVVHHKVHLTPENITDPEIATGTENLIALCADCHAEVHRGTRRWRVLPDGTIAPLSGHRA